MDTREFELLMVTEGSWRGVLRQIVRWHYAELDENSKKLVPDMLTTENAPSSKERVKCRKNLTEFVTSCQKIMKE